jgi:hypothetical protein
MSTVPGISDLRADQLTGLPQLSRPTPENVDGT